MALEGTTLFALGTALVIAGGVTTLVMLTRAGAMGRTSKAFDNLKAYFESEETVAGRSILIVAAVLTVLGLMMTLSARRDREPRSIGQTPQCQESCALQGYDSGVVRGNPHTGERPTPANRRCYCRCDDGSWADEAVDPSGASDSSSGESAGEAQSDPCP